MEIIRVGSVTMVECKIWPCLPAAKAYQIRNNKGGKIHFAKGPFYFCLNHDAYAEINSKSSGDEVIGVRAGKWALTFFTTNLK